MEDADPKERLDSELFEYLVGKKDIAGQLVIICASAGVGKTTLARQLTVDLANRTDANRIIPTYVEASHWGKLKLESINELWEIIENSIRTFSPNLTISEELFEHCLKHGYLAFIFDGFDELCGHRYSPFRSREVLERLANIATESNAKIALTTRTLYWKAEIQESPGNVTILNLATFNTQQAKGYFQKFFSKNAKARDRAVTLYKKLVKANVPPSEGGVRTQFANLPLCVGMIAEYVRIGATGPLTPQSGKGLVRDILYQICDREKKRKKLLTEAEDQLIALEDIAVDQSEAFRPEFDLELLEIAGFDENDISRLIDHPLVTTDDNVKYRFNYDFSPQYLKAFFLFKEIQATDGLKKRDMWKIMSREANGRGFILEHVLLLMSLDNLEDISNCYQDIPSQYDEAKSFLFHLAKQIIDQSGFHKTRNERTNVLFSTFDADFNDRNVISGLYLIGNIAGLDLSGVTLRNCVFADVVFTRCDANTETIFDTCRFSGELDFQNVEKKAWSQVKLNDCTLLPPSNLIWEEIRGESLETREKHVMDALSLALSKFWYHGQFKKSIRKDNWRRGSLGHSIYCDKILKAMLKLQLVEEVSISGVSEGGYVFSMKSVSDLQRFMDNRQLAGKIREVYDYLVRD
jgi:hypothetical protein